MATYYVYRMKIVATFSLVMSPYCDLPWNPKTLCGVFGSYATSQFHQEGLDLHQDPNFKPNSHFVRFSFSPTLLTFSSPHSSLNHRFWPTFASSGKILNLCLLPFRRPVFQLLFSGVYGGEGGGGFFFWLRQSLLLYSRILGCVRV